MIASLNIRSLLPILVTIPFFTGSIADIDRTITGLVDSRSLYPRTHPEYVKCVYHLAHERWARYELSRDKQDRDKSIVHCTEAILLPPASLEEHSGNVVRILFHLANILLERFVEFEQPEDIKCSIEYFRYLRHFPVLALDSFDVPLNDVTTSLILSLGIQVEKSEVGIWTGNIKEMVDLCRGLFASSSSAGFPVDAFGSLSGVVVAEFIRGRAQSVDLVVECLRDATKICPPDSHHVFYALVRTLRIRLMITHSIEDYEEAMAQLERILNPNQSGECSDQMRCLSSEAATMLAITRSAFFENPQYSEAAISQLRTFLSSPSHDEQLRLELTSVLAIAARERFKQYGLAESLEEADSSTSQLADLSSSENRDIYGELLPAIDLARVSYSTTRVAEKVQYFEGLLSTTLPGTSRHRQCLDHLARWHKTKFYHTNDLSDIEESIRYSRLSVDATHSSNLWRPASFVSLRDSLDLAFEKTKKISYLDESIDVSYDILESSAQVIHFHATWKLVRSLLTRENLLGRREDRCEAIRIISVAIDDQYTGEPDRFRLSCQWALLARSVSHPTTLTAYKSAMALMQKFLASAPTVSIQHTRLVKMGEDCQTMPLDYASYQIGLGLFEEAVETLEQGRALLWSEMRSLRSMVAELIEDSPLAKRFSEINQELEALTISVTPSGKPEMEDAVARGRNLMDPFGRLVVKQQKLVEERDALVSQIQGIPGLERFWKAPSFTPLRSAALHGPVIIINHCEWRSDILIISHNSVPCCIPTADDFYTRANKIRDELADARKHGLDSSKYQDALCSVLKGLYDLVGEPVIKRLRTIGVPEQSRIWWCPTSVFCSLPLHAMGPIPSRNNSDQQYFSDLYIPSYTPSLSALIESRKASPRVPDKPSLLLVAQPEDSLPGVRGEIKVVQRALKTQVTVTGLVSNEATPSSVVEGLRGSQFAHFACHGVLETGKPFEASFKLHEGERLTLLDMVRSRLPDAEFAFLSCCHTAEITDESVADEGLHLTAAMQYCGFRSVVGTMWEMADTDGRDLAKSFYKSLFSNPETGVRYYERSAGALRDATRKLREKRGISLERWVNFVHYGA